MIKVTVHAHTHKTSNNINKLVFWAFDSHNTEDKNEIGLQKVISPTWIFGSIIIEKYMLVLLFGLQCTIEFVELFEALISSAGFDEPHTYRVWQATYWGRGHMGQLHFLTLSLEVVTRVAPIHKFADILIYRYFPKYCRYQFRFRYSNHIG